jgi:hypothetical protein
MEFSSMLEGCVNLSKRCEMKRCVALGGGAAQRHQMEADSLLEQFKSTGYTKSVNLIEGDGLVRNALQLGLDCFTGML